MGVGGGVLGYLTLCEAPGGVGGLASLILLLPRGGGLPGSWSMTLSLSCSIEIGDDRDFDDVKINSSSIFSISRSAESTSSWKVVKQDWLAS